MAGLQCRRTLRQYGLHAGSEELVTICCRMARDIVNETLFYTSNNPREWSKKDQDSITNACKIGLALIKQVKELFPSKFPQSIHGHIEYSHIYIAIYKSFCIQDWCKSLRLAFRLVEQSSSSTTSDNSNNNIQAKQILAQALEFSGDFIQAQLILENLIQDGEKAGYLQMAIESAVLKASVIMNQPSSSQSQKCDALLILHRNVVLSRCYLFPTVEKIAAHIIKQYQLQQQ